MPSFRHESPQDLDTIENLLDEVFGNDRHKKKSYHYRDGVPPVAPLSHVALDRHDQLVATIRYWPIAIGPNDTPALLLGPVAVKPERKGEGIGIRLIEMTLQMAANAGHSLVVLVGDPPYYARFGFKLASEFDITMPGEDPARLQVLFLNDGANANIQGEIRKAR